MDDVLGVPPSKYVMVYRAGGETFYRALRGGVEGAKRTAQHLIVRRMPSPVEWVEIRASGVVIYRTERSEWE